MSRSDRCTPVRAEEIHWNGSTIGQHALLHYDHAVPVFTMGTIVARAEMTRTVAHGERYLLTRLLLSDGRVLQQMNPGLPDLENDWQEVGRYSDLGAELAGLRRTGWAVRRG